MKTGKLPLPPLKSARLLDQLRERVRYLHYSLRTEQADLLWVRAFIRFHGLRHPSTLGSPARLTVARTRVLALASPGGPR